MASGGSNSRANRLRRWLGGVPASTQVVAIEVMRNDEWEPLQVAAAEEIQARAAELGQVLSEALQDEADARGGGQLVVARAAAYDGDRDPNGKLEPMATISLRATASEDAEQLADGVYDGTQQGQIAQLQQHVQALIRMSVEERMATQRSVRQAMELQGQVIERLLARQERESARVDELREALAESAPEWLELVKAAPHIMPALEPVIRRFANGKTKKAPAKKADDAPKETAAES